MDRKRPPEREHREAEELCEGPDHVVHLHHLEDLVVSVLGGTLRSVPETSDSPDEAIRQSGSSNRLIDEDTLEADSEVKSRGTKHHSLEQAEPHVLERSLKP